MADAITTFTARALIGIGIVVRASTAVLALVLIARAVISRFLPKTFRHYVDPLNRYTDDIVSPVKNVLPPNMRNDRADYTPLITALMLLFLGFGFYFFITIIVFRYLST